MSWGLPESRDRSGDFRFVAPNVSFVAAAGDYGNPAFWPATSADVTAVGGTQLHLDGKGNRIGELGWEFGGGGLSRFVLRQLWQAAFSPFEMRALPDVAYNAAQSTPFAVYSTFNGGWRQVGGTSAGAPQWAALLAIVNSRRDELPDKKPPLTGSNPALYGVALNAYATNYYDVIVGSNSASPSIFPGFDARPPNRPCEASCTAQPGYDYITGLGTPRADRLIDALVNAQ
jgi:subtilase family serine protease